MVRRALFLVVMIFTLSTTMGAALWDSGPLVHDADAQAVEVPVDTVLFMSPEVRDSIAERFLLWSQGDRPDAIGCMMGQYIGPWQIQVDSVVWAQEVCVASVGLFIFLNTQPDHPMICQALSSVHEEYPEVHDISVVYGVKDDGGFKEMGCLLRDAHKVSAPKPNKRL